MLWIWWWLLFVLIFLLLPLGYGWCYRGWGPPHYRRPGRPLTPAEAEQLQRKTIAEEQAEAEGWGWIALALWFLFAVAVVWLVLALIWVA